MDIEGVITTRHSRPDCVAESLRPDNLSSMDTGVQDGTVITRVRSPKLRSVIVSVDDYLMNLAIAEEICSYVSH